MDRRELLKVLPGIGMIGKPGSEEAKPFEEELREILEHSPHLARIEANEDYRIRVWLDGQECRYAIRVVGSPRPNVSVWGAVYVCINERGEMATDINQVFLRGDEIAAEWRIGMVTWRHE